MQKKFELSTTRHDKENFQSLQSFFALREHLTKLVDINWQMTQKCDPKAQHILFKNIYLRLHKTFNNFFINHWKIFSTPKKNFIQFFYSWTTFRNISFFPWKIQRCIFDASSIKFCVNIISHIDMSECVNSIADAEKRRLTHCFQASLLQFRIVGSSQSMSYESSFSKLLDVGHVADSSFWINSDHIAALTLFGEMENNFATNPEKFTKLMFSMFSRKYEVYNFQTSKQ